MAFLDNSGDIILDAVLTDTGRHRLAKGDGTFRISKFALGDDEINYTLYDKNNSSGSAYYDLTVLQTPVLEAFTNNTSLMKSKLISVPRTNLLYLPVLKQNTVIHPTYSGFSQGHLVLVDEDTELMATANDSGVLFGANLNANTRGIRVDQGLDTTELSTAFILDADLVETQYIVEVDNRFGQIYSTKDKGNVPAKVSFIDDDQIASYYLSVNTDSAFVYANDQAGLDKPQKQVISGPKGSVIELTIKASIDLNSSTFLFAQLGSTVTLDLGAGSTSFYYIDTTVRISGATTGYRIDIPIRFLKKV